MKIGSKTPDFSLTDTNRELKSLSELTKNGNLLLLFFPFAFSSTCTTELCTTRDNMKFYNAVKTTVAGISVDSHYTLREYKKANNLNFHLLSDFNKEASKAFGVLYDEYKGMRGVSKRASFVISPEKIVLFKEVLEDAGELPDFRSINKALSK